MANEIYHKSKKIIREILLSQSMTKEDLLCYLYNFSNIGQNYVPLEIKRGKIESKILDDIIIKDDCIDRNGENLLTIKQRCKNKISYPLELPIKNTFNYKDVYNGSSFIFCEEVVKLKPQYSPEMAKIAPLIPNTADLGALFTIPEKNKIFELFLPLYQEDDETIIFEINSGISKTTAQEKYIETFSLIERYLFDYLPNCDVEKTLIKFLNVIYPVSVCTYNEFCITPTGENHVNSSSKSEDYLANSKRMKKSRCYCGRTISYRVTKLKSEKIKDNLKYGVFSEWYASKKIESAGLNETLWNTNIIFNNSIEKHIDAIGFNDDLIILMECKRIYRENSDFQHAVFKLQTDKFFFQEKYPDKEVVVGLMTNFRDSNITPNQIDFHINHNNFLEFEDILKNYI
ncbi:MAG: hypothetical protein MIO93_08875 [ANME-2 cluster archaeon]|nr:hypothetical protein [ANME-2 cluster archaeon]